MVDAPRVINIDFAGSKAAVMESSRFGHVYTLVDQTQTRAKYPENQPRDLEDLEETALAEKLFNDNHPLAMASRRKLEDVVRIIDEVADGELLGFKKDLLRLAMVMYRITIGTSHGRTNGNPFLKVVSSVGRLFGTSEADTRDDLEKVNSDELLTYAFKQFDQKFKALPVKKRAVIAPDLSLEN